MNRSTTALLLSLAAGLAACSPTPCPRRRLPRRRPPRPPSSTSRKPPSTGSRKRFSRERSAPRRRARVPRSASRRTTAPACNSRRASSGRITTIPHAGQINALTTLNLRPAARKAWGFDDRKARSMTDAADDDPDMPDALEVGRGARREVRAHRQARRAAARRGDGDQGPVRHVRHAHARPARTRSTRTTVRRTTRRSSRACATAGAIILAKANLGEYASATRAARSAARSATRTTPSAIPSGSSAGSGSSVAANLVTCAIAEETGSSIRGPARANSAVGIAPTQELVSRDGMIQRGHQHARRADLPHRRGRRRGYSTSIAGYDPKDELTAFSVGRMPRAAVREVRAPRRGSTACGSASCASCSTRQPSLPRGHRTVDLVDQALVDLKSVGAEIVDPGAGGALLASCVRK